MKKFFCLLMVMVTCFSVTSYAGTELKDIKDAECKDAVEKLMFFEIVNGYEDGTFKPENKVTRAELSKMLVVAMGKTYLVEDAKKKYLDFNDVLSSYWAYGHIKVASDAGLVNGYEDGSFKPAGNVTYAEAAAMVLRALDYEDGVKKSELTWPNNYMSYADDLDLFEGIGNIKASEPANRGDIAILIWNAMRTGTAEIVAYNDKGVIYGEGTPMITLYLGYTYIENAEITNIEFSDDYREAEITFKEEDEKEKELTFPAKDALDMYGRKVTLIYDKAEGEVVQIEVDEEYKSVDAEVTNISDSKIYVANKKNGYKLPSEERILLYGIDDESEAAEAILILDGSTLKYLVLMGASDVRIGRVVDDRYLIKDEDDEDDPGEYGVEIREVGKSSKDDTAYFVAGDEWPEDDDIIMYYIDSDDMLVVLKTIDVDKAEEVDDISKNYIEIDGDEYEFDDSDEYTVININGSKIKETTLTDIDENADKVVVINYNMHYYFFVIDDAVADNIDPDVQDALEALEEMLEEALEYDEGEYTQESFYQLLKVIDAAKDIDYNTKLSKIRAAVGDLEEAIESLDKAGKTEKKLVAQKKILRELVNEEADQVYEDEDLYTTKSYAVFEEAYEYALDILDMDDASKAEIEDAIEELENAIDDLIKK